MANTTLIAIDGYGASGKSTLADRLAVSLDAGVIRLDDFDNGQAFGWRPRLEDEALQPIEAGATSLAYQPADWWGCRPPPRVEQPVRPVMIVEGVGSHHPDLVRRWGVTILVDTPPDVCFRRGVERDLVSGVGRGEIERQWQTWQADEIAYSTAHNPAASADFVVDGTASWRSE